jgi:hypothetical protein
MGLVGRGAWGALCAPYLGLAAHPVCGAMSSEAGGFGLPGGVLLHCCDSVFLETVAVQDNWCAAAIVKAKSSGGSRILYSCNPSHHSSR